MPKRAGHHLEQLAGEHRPLEQLSADEVNQAVAAAWRSLESDRAAANLRLEPGANASAISAARSTTSDSPGAGAGGPDASNGQPAGA